MNATEKKYVEKLKEYIPEILKYKFVIPMDMYDKFESQISALESQIREEESYPREFVEWINSEDDRDDFHFIKDYTMNLWLNADEDMLGYNTDELFDYWQSKVKPK